MWTEMAHILIALRYIMAGIIALPTYVETIDTRGLKQQTIKINQ